jgi:hypothetical protein
MLRDFLECWVISKWMMRSAVIKNDHSVAEPKCRGRNHNHVDGDEVCQIVSREAAPSGGGFIGPPCHGSPNGSLTHVDPSLSNSP